MTRHLRAVPPASEAPIDIGELMRRERDDPARWQRVHVEGDKNPPLLGWAREKLRGWR